MDSLQLLREMQQKNDEAFKSFVRICGTPVYGRLLEKSGNEDISKRALKAALVEMYMAVSAADCKDPLEALLHDRAAQIQENMIRNVYGKIYSETEENAGTFYVAPTDKASMQTQTVQSDQLDTANRTDTDNEQTQPPHEEPVTVQKKRTRSTSPVKKGWIVLLSFGILLSIWVIVGLLMDMELLPAVDLGYSWFNMNIAPWF